MNEIKILNLSLRNFKGIKEFTLDAQGSDINIYGENGTGKTTVMDAFLWLLFDKDSANSSNFNIKTLDELGQPLHGLEHEVTARLLINDKEIELQKIYKENWVKKKGQLQEELTGHTKNYFINGVPKKQKEYNEYLSNIVKEDNFKILTNPLFFNTSLTWKERRNIILELEKDIKEEDIYKKDKDLLPLKELLVDKTVDDLKAEMSSRRRKLNEELKSIPSRIDELSRMNSDIDIESLNKGKEKLEGKLEIFKTSTTRDYSFNLRGIESSIKILNNELKDLERSLTEEIRTELDQVRKDRYKVEKQRQELESKAFRLDKGVITLEQTIKSIEVETEGLREKFRDVQVSEFEGTTICPTCQQSLPSDEIKDAMDRFEKNKAKQLGQINQTGKENKSLLEKHKKELETTQSELSDISDELKTIFSILAEKNTHIEKLERDLECDTNISSTIQYKENREKILKLAKEKIEIEELMKKQDFTEDIRKLENEILDINKELAKVDLVKENKKRVDELMTRETELAQNIAETEKVEFLCDQYVITKSSLLEDKLNSKFNLVKFKLFNVQVNGGIDETFVTTVNGVPFEDLNNAMKIQAGLDIITTLSQQYELIAPIFLDNRESVNEIPDMKAQVINLIVSKHKNLRVEVE